MRTKGKLISALDVSQALKRCGEGDRAKGAARYFQAYPGGYGEGDVFRGISVPVTRKVAKEFSDISLGETCKLLASRFHEDRLAALEILKLKFKTGDEKLQEKIFRIYLNGAKWINNWDLIDGTAPHILGAWLDARSREPLIRLAGSSNLWERRMAILATLWFIRKGEFEPTFRIANLLMNSPEDLIHKAVGWMVREVGNRHLAAEKKYLKVNYRRMPRTMLRYAIEKFPESLRVKILQGRF